MTRLPHETCTVKLFERFIVEVRYQYTVEPEGVVIEDWKVIAMGQHNSNRWHSTPQWIQKMIDRTPNQENLIVDACVQHYYDLH